MAAIADAVKEFFDQDEWPYTQSEDGALIQTGFAGEHGEWACFAHVREDQEQVVFYSLCPVKTPESRRSSMAEYLTRANFGLILGNFEMDMNDGEIRYKTSLDVEGASLMPSLVKQLVYANILMMDRYLPGIMLVIYSNMEPAAAIAQVE